MSTDDGQAAAVNNEEAGTTAEAGAEAQTAKPKREKRVKVKITDEQAAEALGFITALVGQNVAVTSKALSEAMEQPTIKLAKSILAKLKKDGHVKVVSTRQKDVPVIYGLTA